MDIVLHNPYRYLGIYANASAKERAKMQSQITAFLRIDRPIELPLDKIPGLPALKRDTDSLNRAIQELTLPADQIRYAQFWFISQTPFDEIAFNHLLAGDRAEAILIWSRKETPSSLQNQLVLALLNNNLRTAIPLAEKLYEQYKRSFAEAILGEQAGAHLEQLEEGFLAQLLKSYSAQQLLPDVTREDWRKQLKEQGVQPLIQRLENKLAETKAVPRKRPQERLQAGRSLTAECKKSLKTLADLLGGKDTQYQLLADKLANEILQCSIDYYNNDDDADPRVALELLSAAAEIAVGSVTKDRCKENRATLEKRIKELPPASCEEEDRRIRSALNRFNKQPDEIEYSVILLRETTDQLRAIKSKLESSNSYYLEISSLVGTGALHNVIEEVNEKQAEIAWTFKVLGRNCPSEIESLKNVLRKAWAATKQLDELDKTPEFQKRYDENRSTLQGLCKQVGISTSSSFNLFEHISPGCLFWIIIGLIILFVNMLK